MMSQPAPKIPRETERKTLAKIVVLPVHPCQVRIGWLSAAAACATQCCFLFEEALTALTC